jgi:hypothetical protein
MFKKLNDQRDKLKSIVFELRKIMDLVLAIFQPCSAGRRKITEVIKKELDAGIAEEAFMGLEPYTKEIWDAVKIFEIGCPREAIGAIGRVLETSIDNYLVKANKKHKIQLSETKRKSMTFDQKIRYLASGNGGHGRKKQVLIKPNEESKMLSIKWDRNVGDHPASVDEINSMVRDSKALLELGINMIRFMHAKMKEL